MQSQPIAQRAAPTLGLADALMFVVISLVERSLAVGWALVRRPIASVPIAVFVGVAAWCGLAVASGLLVSGLLVLALWRLATHFSASWAPRCAARGGGCGCMSGGGAQR
jgi:uncharacterized membrane protein YGL010W